MDKTTLIDIFYDTTKLCVESYTDVVANTLQHSTTFDRKSNVTEYMDALIVDKQIYRPVICVTDKTTIGAALGIRKGKTAILNFASATNPGGGVKYGSAAQEECLCRQTTLYLSLALDYVAADKYYDMHKKQGHNIYTDALVYSPNVLILKDDKYNRVDQQKRYVDVITCAAPNLRQNPQNIYNADTSSNPVNATDEELYTIHYKRGHHILYAALRNGCDNLILGAFGCGAFRNNPEVVARAYRDLIDNYGKYFQYIEFAVYCSDAEKKNYNTFKKVIG